MMTFATLMQGRSYAEILCPFKKIVVRKLTVRGDVVELDAISEKVDVPLNTVITYQPWTFDRGSMLFDLGKGPLKLCTEQDLLKFEDGTERWVEPE